ncbi:hypothetical protein CONPUDRAFT_148537 [Coniophora puteana RWD-64-598 SS2]|uniref:Chalcone isomerase domain-containing protein n=1 Tax=Coniophora puteana (strain RWD-64-598) TaxID=741705 RepID=A0A5M3N4V6_CONPW|nr:uncharacterized protein CONPUDRAFT_148537 [Coniophora puteana RWD-64-598 SS2]EIW86449.1 hypothetical protein CONPUDRAFT_148537 [Coniophora puteana RWD-64-598 SS2]
MTLRVASPLHKSRKLAGRSLLLASAGLAITAWTAQPLQLDATLSTESIQVDPATSIEFPTVLNVPSKVYMPTFTLMGVGVRTVSFLGIKVYSVGFYADLSNPSLKDMPMSATKEEKVDYIVRNTACALRIIPTRQTSYSHLRDGFVRALVGRLQLAKQKDSISAKDEVDAQSPIRKLKTMFPTSSMAKGTPLDVVLTAPSANAEVPRSLIFRDLGALESNWVATEFVLAYFEGQGISPPLKKNVFERVDQLQSL